MPKVTVKLPADIIADRKASLPDALSEAQLARVSTGRVRYALSQLAQNNVDNVQRWIDAIELIDGPKAAFDCYMKMIEYSVPKLSRTEVKVEDTAGASVVAELSIPDLQALIAKGVEAAREQERTIEGEIAD